MDYIKQCLDPKSSFGQQAVETEEEKLLRLNEFGFLRNSYNCMNDVDVQLEKRYKLLEEKRKRFEHEREKGGFMSPTLSKYNSHKKSLEIKKQQSTQNKEDKSFKNLKLMLNSPSEISNTNSA